MKSINKNYILKYLAEVKPLLEADGIKSIGLFGSYAKESETIFSDIDIFIETQEAFFEKYKGFNALLRLEYFKEMFQKHFKRKIDLVDINKMSSDKKEILLQRAIYV